MANLNSNTRIYGTANVDTSIAIGTNTTTSVTFSNSSITIVTPSNTFSVAATTYAYPLLIAPAISTYYM